MKNPEDSPKPVYIFAKSIGLRPLSLICCFTLAAAVLPSCGESSKATTAENSGSQASAVSVGVTKLGRQPLQRQLTVSSELVPFQQIDVYAKESGYVRQLSVDFGTRVKAGQVMAVLEIPELQLQLQQDDAAIKHSKDQVTQAEHQLGSIKAQHKVLSLAFERLSGVAKTQPGLIAQQELDDAQGKDLAAEAQEAAAESNLEAAQSELEVSQAKRAHDQALFDYANITAPFDGTVTQRYANQGTLLQAGTNSSTQAMPLVQLSEDDRFRLVIPVPETYVRYIHIGDPVQVSIPALNKTISGKVIRFSVDVKSDTRTMHTEVDVYNPDHTLVPGMYAEATLSLERNNNALAVPLQAVSLQGDQATVYVVGQGNKIEIRKVTLGIQTASYAEVISGLQEGDLVVLSDRSGLRAGQEVHTTTMALTEYKDQNAKE